MKTHHAVLVVVACVVLLGGCATTSYRDGTYEWKQSEDTYLVGFKGNANTDGTDVGNYAVIRAVEIGRKLGYKWMAIEGTRDVTTRRSVNFSTPETTTGTFTDAGFTAVSVGGGTSSFPVFEPGYEILVKYFEEKPDGKFLELHNLDELWAEIKERYPEQAKLISSTAH